MTLLGHPFFESVRFNLVLDEVTLKFVYLIILKL